MFFKKKICYVLMLALCILQLAACKNKVDKPDNSSVEVFTINDQKIFLDEVMYRVWESEDENSYYSKDYQEKYGKSYWDSEIVKGTPVRDSLKEQLYDDIVRDALLYQKAKEKGYTLTSAETKLYEDEVNSEWNELSKDVRKNIGASKDLLLRIKEKKGLIDKYFTDVLKTYKVDEDKVKASINLDQYKEIDVQTIGYYKYTYGEDGSEIKKSKEENEMGLESLTEIADKAKTAKNFDDLLTDDSDPLETEELSIIPGETACDKKIQDAASSMKPGEVSDIIDTESGYFIVKVLDNTSDDAYEEAISDAIKQEKYKQFDKYFDTLIKSADIQTTKEWDDIKVGGTVIKES